MYDSIDDLPFVCRLNLPPAALRVYREAFNEAWREAPEGKSRHHVAQHSAWTMVRNRFHRDPITGRWMPKPRPDAAGAVAARPRSPEARATPAESSALGN